MSLIRLLDVSGIFWPIWKMKEAKGEAIGEAAKETVRLLRERAVAHENEFVVACCDTGRSFRHEIAEEYRTTAPDFAGYKGHRPEKDPAMMAALNRVIDEVEADGVPIMRAQGFEADDVIATLTAWAVEQGHDVEIHSEDKDLLSLVRDPNPDDSTSPSVVVIRRDKTRQGGAECIARVGVPPELVPHFLAMQGDASDGVLGIPEVGKKTAVALLWGETVDGQWCPTPYRRFDDIVSAAVEDQVAWENHICYRAHEGAAKGATHETIAKRLNIAVSDVPRYLARTKPEKVEYKATFAKDVRQSLIRYASRFEIGLRLTTLRADVPLDFAQVTAPRVPKPRPPSDGWQKRTEALAAPPEPDFEDFNEEPAPHEEQNMPTENITEVAPSAVIVEPVPSAPRPVIEAGAGIVVPGEEPKQSAAVGLAKAENNHARLARYVLEPRNYTEARIAAEDAAESHLYKGITTAAEALQVIMKGRKYGLTVADSLQMIHMIEGKPSMSAQLIIGLVMSSGYAEYLDFVDVTDTSATWETMRRGARGAKRWTFSVDDARKALLGGSWDKKKNEPKEFDPESNWAKHPKVMCLWRAGVFLCRAVYTDIVGGLYMPDEIGGREPEIIDGNLPTHGQIIQVAA